MFVCAAGGVQYLTKVLGDTFLRIEGAGHNLFFNQEQPFITIVFKIIEGYSTQIVENSPSEKVGILYGCAGVTVGMITALGGATYLYWKPERNS